MKFMVGYQANDALYAAILRHRESISEIYFPWFGFTSGRGVPDDGDQRRMESELEDCRAAGIGMNLLLNGNCFGRYAQSRAFFQSVGGTVDMLIGRCGLDSVTTTSPIVAKFLHTNFPTLEVRASVNMEIGTTRAMDYIAEWFDGYYLKREYNRDRARIDAMRQWCDEHGKKLYMLANSGCLNFCSARTFHDNLVAHQHEIAEMDNAYDFPGVCHEYMASSEHRAKYLADVNFVRPEDLALYDGMFDGIKLATRTNRNPSAVVEAYITRQWTGNLLDLTEPSHAARFYPAIVANDRIPEEFGRHVLECDKQCDTCHYCDRVLKLAAINLETMGGLDEC